MKTKPQSKKEISSLISAFIVIGILSLSAKYFEYYIVKTMHTTTNDIFEHPLKVSNAALTIEVDVYKIHRDMKDIVLSSSKSEITELSKEIDQHEKHVYKNLDVIEKNILGEEGLVLQKNTKKLFESWKPIRDEVIGLKNSSKTKEAIDITRGKGAKHVLKLESSAIELYNYAQNKAIYFKNESHSAFEKIELITIFTSILFLLILVVIGYYIIGRISHCTGRNEHLKNILSVIRDVNQLIVREKNPQKMIQESCNILISTGVYGQAWIVTYNDDGKTEYFATTDIENIDMLKDKIKSGWTPYCIKKTKNIKKSYSFIEDTLSECSSCPLAGLYDDKSAFNIQLKYNHKVYGYLTLSLEKMYIGNHDELALLDEVAKDISYALYNIKTEEQFNATKEQFEYAINGTRDGLWDWNLQTNEIYYSPRWKEILGYADDELPNVIESWSKNIHPDDVEKIDEAVIFSREKPGRFYENIHRIQHKNGSWVLVLDRGQTIFNEDGKAVRMVGFYTDITEQKQMEEKIINEEKRLSDLLNNLNVGIVVHASDTSILYNNPMASKLLGLDDIEIEGALATDEQWTFVCEDNTPMELEKYPVNVVLSTKKPLHNMVMGIVQKNNSGSVTNTEWALVEGFPIFNNKNEVKEVIISFSDISEIKQAEQELQISNDKFEKAFNKTPNIKIISNLKTDKIYEINETCEHVLGYNKEEIIGKTTIDINLWNDKNDRKKHIDTLNKNGSIKGDVYNFNKKNGEVIIVSLYTNIIMIDGEEYVLMVGDDITSKHKTENQVEILFTASNIGLAITSLEKGWIRVNEKLLSILGYTENELKQTTWSDITYPDDIQKDTKLFNEVVEGKRYGYEIEKRLIKKDGTFIDTILTLSVYRYNDKIEYFLASILDISELKKVQHELETIIQEAPNPIMIYSEDGKILMLNKVWEQLTGYSYSEINTIEKWTKKAYGKEMPTIKKYIDNLYELQHAANEGEYSIVTNSGEIIIWQFSSAPLGVMGGKRTVISSAMDITELKKKDEMIINQSRQAAMGDMIAMIAHQWRQPISVIAMEANNIMLNIDLEEEITTQNLKAMADTISKQTQQLSQTIDDFRNFFKPNQEKVQTTVGNVLESTLKIIGKSLENSNITVMIKNQSETKILTYSSQLLQVFLNLLGNAKDILLDKVVTDAKITITINEIQDSIMTTICDNGGGISKDAIKRLGEPYFTTKEKSTGTGLGLYMSITIVKKHLNGSLAWENRDEGACFIVTLPKE